MKAKQIERAPDAPEWEFVRDEVVRTRELTESILKAIGRSFSMEPPRRVVHAKVAQELIGDGNSMFWARQNPKCASWDPDFPRAFKLGQGQNARSVWYLDELEAWISKRAAQSPKRSSTFGQRKVLA